MESIFYNFIQDNLESSRKNGLLYVYFQDLRKDDLNSRCIYYFKLRPKFSKKKYNQEYWNDYMERLQDHFGSELNPENNVIQLLYGSDFFYKNEVWTRVFSMEIQPQLT